MIIKLISPAEFLSGKYHVEKRERMHIELFEIISPEEGTRTIALYEITELDKAIDRHNKERSEGEDVYIDIWDGDDCVGEIIFHGREDK